MKGLHIREERLLEGDGECRLLLCGRPLYENCVERGARFRLLVTVPRRLAALRLELIFGPDEGEEEQIPMCYRGLAEGRDLYEVELSCRDVGLYRYDFRLTSPFGEFFGSRCGHGRRLSFSRERGGRRFQMLSVHFEYPPPRWLLGGIIYHVFVDRFRRAGDPPLRADAILNPDWEAGIPAYPKKRGDPLENNEFFGGTLDGIAEKLPDIASLGVNCLYLSPIFEAYSNHKYDTGDYERIDEMFGGEEAFLRLLAECERYGIRIVLDAVFNHTGSDSVYFNKKGRYPSLGAYQSVDSPYYPWYRFSRHPEEYESWWGIDILPRLDPAAPSLRRFFVGEGGIVDRYARTGIGGLRLDVVDELTDDFVTDIKARLASAVPDAVLLGEVWEDASHKVAYGVRKRYYEGRQLDGVMNYPLRAGLIEYLRAGATERLSYALLEVLPNMPKRIADATMNLLGSHDTVRILTALAGKGEAGYTMEELATLRLTAEEYERGRRLLILGYLILATLPGVPSIYYGDEVGLEGYSDPFNRRPYPWHRRDAVLLSAYRRIGAMRRQEPILRDGRFSPIVLTEEVLVFLRTKGKRALLVAVNRSKREVCLSFSSPVRVVFGRGGRGLSYTLGKEEGAAFSVPRGTRLRLFFADGAKIFRNM